MNLFPIIDWTVVGMYFLILFGIDRWAIKQKQASITDCFLAGRHIVWFVVGALIFRHLTQAEETQ